MAKFKKGDRVRSIEAGYVSSRVPIGTKGTIIDATYKGSNGDWVVLAEWDGYGQNTWHEKFLELAEPTYTPITPEVGQKYRVVKQNLDSDASPREIGHEFVVDKIEDSETPVRDTNGKWFVETWFTTEYLELVEEPKGTTYRGYADKVQIAQDWATQAYETMNQLESFTLQDEPKLTTMQKLTSALKRALSSDKQALYKTGIINGGLELSSEGRVAYVNALFQNEGDHKAAMAEMVEAAKEEIKDNE